MRALPALLALALVPLVGCGEVAPQVPAPEQVPAASLPAAASPRVVATDPPTGASAVDPARTTLSVTFDRPMDPEGWAWVVEDDTTAPEIGEQVVWSPDGRTCTVAVTLAPDRSYVVWINSARFGYFKDRAGAIATPYRWTFATAVDTASADDSGPAAEGTAAATSGPHLAPLPSAGPQIVSLEPANGATGVDPATGALRVTFDRPMQEGWSWVTEGGATFPETAGSASFGVDRRTNVLPVRLRPGTTYVIWLNSSQFRDFADLEGRPLEPVRWTFTTAAE